MSNSDKNLIWAVAGAVAFAATIVVNALANALPINGLNTGEVSDRYPSLFTPAGVTFSIWSVIYLLLLAFVVYQFLARDRAWYPRLSRLFIVTCILNVTWILVWHYLFAGISVVIMLLFLATLTRIFLMLRQQPATTWKDRIFVNLPFTIYFAWISVATIANISAWLVSTGWDGTPLSEELWAIVMMTAASLLAIIVLMRHGQVAFVVVVMWALAGIALRGYALIQPAALILIALLVVASAYYLLWLRKNQRQDIHSKPV